MSLIASLGALEIGLIFGLVALGVYVSFRIINFPDLTVDGSFPLGAAVAASLIVNGWNPFAATAVAFMAGALAGLATGWLNVKLKIMQLLAGILVMIALYSINLRVMGKPNVALINEATVFTMLSFGDLPDYWLKPMILLVITVIVKLALDAYFASEVGLAMRATGGNPRMARSQGVSTDSLSLLGLGLSNGIVALAGALFAQSQGGADVSLGIGTIVIGLAAVIIGETLMPGRSIFVTTLGCVVGAILYRMFIAVALNSDFIGLKAQDLNLVTAVLVTVALLMPTYRQRSSNGFPHARQAPRGRDHAHRTEPEGHLPPRHTDGESRAARAGPDHTERAVRDRHRIEWRRQVDFAECTQRRSAGGQWHHLHRRHGRDRDERLAAKQAGCASLSGPDGRHLRGAVDRREPVAGLAARRKSGVPPCAEPRIAGAVQRQDCAR
jgi:putative ABC transport system permease protein